MKKIFPYNKKNLILSGTWDWGANWEFYLGHNRPNGAESTSAGCILLSPKGIIFTKTVDRGGWELPCGRKQENESIFDTLKREVKEEGGAELLEAYEVAVKVIYNPPNKIIINSETGKKFPLIGFQEYFIGWCNGNISKPIGNEVLESRIFNIKEINFEFLNKLPEPEEFCILMIHFNKILNEKVYDNQKYFIDIKEYWNKEILHNLSKIKEYIKIFKNGKN